MESQSASQPRRVVRSGAAMTPAAVKVATSPPAAVALKSNGDAPSMHVSEAATAASLSETKTLGERLIRARDTLTETELYAQIANASSRVGQRLGSLWSFSKTAGWVVGTSALVLVVPLLYEMDKEIAGAAPSAPPAQTPAPGVPAASGATAPAS